MYIVCYVLHSNWRVQWSLGLALVEPILLSDVRTLYPHNIRTLVCAFSLCAHTIERAFFAVVLEMKNPLSLDASRLIL